MASKRVGKRTVKLQNKPTIISAASIVGPKEGKGPLKDYFNTKSVSWKIQKKHFEIKDIKTHFKSKFFSFKSK